MLFFYLLAMIFTGMIDWEGSIRDLLKGLTENIVAFIKKVPGMFMDLFLGLMKSLFNVALGPIKSLFGGVGSAAKSVGSSISGAFKSLF